MNKFLFSILIYISGMAPTHADVLYELVETKCAKDMHLFSWRSLTRYSVFRYQTEETGREIDAIGEEAKLNQYGFSMNPETRCEIGLTALDRRQIEIRDVTPGGWKNRHPNAVDMELVVDGQPILRMEAIWGIPNRDDQHFLEIWGGTLIHCVQSFGKDQEQPYIAATDKPLEFVTHRQKCRRFTLPSKLPGVE